MSTSVINAGLVGLAMRAGKLISGSEACRLALKAGQARLIIIDEGVSPGTLKEFRNEAAAHGIEIIPTPGGVLGQTIGKPERMVAVVKDESFARGILKSWSKNE